MRNDKVLAYLNKTGLVNFNKQKQCENGHSMYLKKTQKQMVSGGVVLQRAAKKLKL